MITIKLPIEPIEIDEYLNQYNKIVRFAYNRFQENKDITLSEVEKIVKLKMNNIGLMDSSFIKAACDCAKNIKQEKVIFGGKKNWKDYNNKLKSKDDYKAKKNRPLMVRGSKLDNNGNRKFQLDVINNNQVVFKPAKGIKILCKMPKTKHYETLCLLQKLCELGEQPFTCSITKNNVFICFDETILKKEKYSPINKRILALDLNPNFIAFVVSNSNNKILHKEIIGLETLNSSTTNKKRYEDHETTKRIAEIAKHYKVEYVVYEKLEIKSDDKKKGKAFNKLCNNNWRRNRFVNSLKKRCNIIGIQTQEILAKYSTFIGQIDNEQEYDSIAAAMEIARRGLRFINQYIEEKEEKVKGTIIKINESLPVDLADRWKKKLKLTKDLKSYKSLYDQIKKSKYSYRNLFQHKWFSFRMKSKKSLVFVF